MEVSKGRIQL